MVVYFVNFFDMEGIIGGYYENSRKMNLSVIVVNSKLLYLLWVVFEELIGLIEILDFFWLSVCILLMLKI